jgi:hypothetical protein
MTRRYSNKEERDADRQMAWTLMARGIRQNEIARRMEISYSTLRFLLYYVPKTDRGVDPEAICEGCGGPLPCIPCAREARKKSGRVGKECKDILVLELREDDAARMLEIRRERKKNAHGARVAAEGVKEKFSRHLVLDPVSTRPHRR